MRFAAAIAQGSCWSTVSLLLGCSTIACAASANAKDVYNNLDQNPHDSFLDLSCSVNFLAYCAYLVAESEELIAQQFLLGNNNAVQEVTVALARYGAPVGRLDVEIWGDNGDGLPSEQIGVLGSIDVSQLPTTDYGHLVFDDPVFGLVPHTPYHVVLNFLDVTSTITPEALVTFATLRDPSGTNNAALATRAQRASRRTRFRTIRRGAHAALNQAYVQMRVDAILQGDFDNDGSLTARDIDLLTDVVRQSQSRTEFDITGDALIDHLDREYWITELAHSQVGDSDLDGDIQFDDFVALSDNFGQKGGWAEGNFNMDSVVDFADFVALAEGFEERSATMAAAVPEPSSLILLCFCGLAVGSIRRPRNKPDCSQSPTETVNLSTDVGRQSF